MIRSESHAPTAVDRIGRTPVPGSLARNAPIRHIDLSLLACALLLTVSGAFMILSAAPPSEPGAFGRQLAYAAGALVVLGGTLLFDYRSLRSLSPVIYVLTVLGLVAVLSPLGVEAAGATRWLGFGAFQVQPSEMTKAVILVVLAVYLSKQKAGIRARHVAVSLLIAGIPIGLVFLQPDLGTAISITTLTGMCLVLGGAKIRHLIALLLLATVGSIAAVNLGLVHDYQLDRMTAFMDPSPDVRSAGYNLTQSKVAIASGGLTGEGYRADATQTALSFVPEQHTDFIFTAVAEQLGFVGAATLLGLFAFLIWRALRIAALARDRLGTLIAASVAALWAIQVFVNVGMTMGVMPITGIPLPFVSFGGSSLVTNLVCVGLLCNVHMRRFIGR